MSATVWREVVYASPPGFRPLVLDLFVHPAPALQCVHLHGGGWRVGSRRDGPGAAARWTSPPFLEYLAGRGSAVAGVDYRLSGEAVFPAQFDDVRAAVAFLAARPTAAPRPGRGCSLAARSTSGPTSWPRRSPRPAVRRPSNSLPGRATCS